MNDDELMRRISDAIDAPGGLDADDDLRALLADDPEAQAYAADLDAIGEALAARGAALLAAKPREEKDWDALAARIDDALAGELGGDDLEGDELDVTAPPELDEGSPADAAPADAPPADGWGDVSGPRAKGAISDARDPEPRVEMAAPVQALGEAAVIDLAARRRRQALFATFGGIAAAAAVVIGIGFGMTRFDSEPAASAVMAPAEESSAVAAADVPAGPAPPSAAPAPYPWEPTEEAAEPAAELPAAAAAEPWADDRLLAPPDYAAERAQGLARTARATPAPTTAPRPRATASSGSMGRRGSGTSSSPFGGGGSGGSGSGGGGAAGAPADRAPAEAEPSRAEVVNALRPFEVEIQRCAGERREVARVSLTVDGASGRVRSVQVDPPFAGTPAEACMRAVLSRAQLPRSASVTYSLSHPFRPAPIAGGSVSGPAAARARQRRAAPARADEIVEPAFAR